MSSPGASKRNKKSPYEFFSVAADIMVLRRVGRQLQVLLIQRRNPPYKSAWALPGGFLDREEDALTAARRELREETGLRLTRLTEFGSFSDPHRDPRGRTVTIAFYTLLRGARQTAVAGDDAGRAGWFSVSRLPRLAFDHKGMIRKGLRHFRLPARYRFS